MPSRIVSNPARVFEFVSRYVPLEPVGGSKGLGLERDGELIAGVVYEDFNGKNIWMHVAAKPGVQWMTRSYLWYCFHYPFVEMGVDRITGYVHEDTLAARRLAEHMGFELETRLKGAAPNGADVLLYVMWRDKCRFLKGNHGQEG